MADQVPTRVEDIKEPDEVEILETAKDISDLRGKVLRHYDRFLDEVSNKRLKLEDSRKYQLFLLEADELKDWFDDQLKGDDNEVNLKDRVKKHREFEKLINNHAKVVQNVEDNGTSMINDRHFASHKIRVRLDEVQGLWDQVKQKIQDEELALRKLFDQLIRDIDLEMDHIKEKEPFLNSSNLGRDYFGVRNLIKKHEALTQEVNNYQPNIDAINERCNEMISADLFADLVEPKRNALNEMWNDLLAKAEERRGKLEASLQSHQYLANAAEAESWMKEKEPIVCSEDYGKDEDSSEALLKKHEALMSDLEAFKSTVDKLRDQADACRLKELRVSDGTTKEMVQVLADYDPKSPREIAVRRGDIATLLNALHNEWWKIELDDRQGFVPAQYLRRLDSKYNQKPDEIYNIPNRQAQIQDLFADLLQKGRDRLAKLEDSVKAYQVVREAADLTQWIKEKEQFAKVETLGDDLEQVEVLQRKFDDFEKVLKNNQVRLKEMNNVADHLKSIAQPDAANKIAEQIDSLNRKWVHLEQAAQKRRDQLGSAHEVQRFQREVDDTLDWIREKDRMLNNDDYGNDLKSVLALQRKHEGLESDLFALNERIKQLNESADRILQNDPSSRDSLVARQEEINHEWDKVVDKANARKAKLIDSHNLQRLLSDQRDMKQWFDSTTSLVSNGELAPDVAGAEALLDRNKELKAEIDVRTPKLQKLQSFGKHLIDSNHYESKLIEDKLRELEKSNADLRDAWLARKNLLEENLSLSLYYRDCELAEIWMDNREASIEATSEGELNPDNVESLIKQHEDIDKALAMQENKINNLVSEADSLMASGHYAADQIREKCQEVLDRWERLKKRMMELRAKLKETKTIEQFSRDADDIENWIQEKQATALSSSVKDATNIQAKNQKHQALEAELKANEGRIKELLEAGRKLVDSKQAGDTENALLDRITNIDDQYKNLTTVTQEKSFVLKEASQLRSFNASVKDIEFWLGEVEGLLKPEDTGNDLPSVQQRIKQHQLMEADIKGHDERIKHMNNLADSLIQSQQFDSESINGKKQSINERYERLVNLAAYRRNKLNEMSTLYQFFRDIVDEESWIREKKLLAESDDCGRDLAGVQNLRKKHKRLENEIESHTPVIKGVQDAGNKLMAESSVGVPEIEQRLQSLESSWFELQEMASLRNQKLVQSEEYQEFLSRIDEEEVWIKEKQQLLSSRESADSMAQVQGLLKKHELLENDFVSHRDRVQSLSDHGKKLIDKGNHHKQGIQDRLNLFKSRSAELQDMGNKRRGILAKTYNTLEFMWRADVVDSWIDDKALELRSDDLGKDLLSVKSLLAKQERFDSSLDAFEQEGIAGLTKLKDQATPKSADQVEARYDEVMKRWNDLRGASEARRASLNRVQEQFKKIEDVFLTFAKRASAFNSWFENAEEDLTDPVRCNSIEEACALREAHSQFQDSLLAARKDFEDLVELDRSIKAFNVGQNPYTWFTMSALEDTWSRLTMIIKNRESELIKETKRQEENNWLRKQYAKKANALYDWIKETRMWLLAGGGTDNDSLEDQLEAIIKKMNEVRSRRDDMKTIEELGKLQENNLILDNRYTEHSTTSLGQEWNQLEELGLRMQHNLEQQIQAKNQSGVSEEALREFSIMFKYFDHDNSGRLDHVEFKNCLRALGYDLPSVAEGEPDPEFETILESVDPNRDGFVSLQEYMAFLISRETENVHSSKDIEQAFKAITLNSERNYVTREELYSNLRQDVADFCISKMAPHHDTSIRNAYDYTTFTKTLFV